MIKDQIRKLVEGYKEDFYEKTGILLHAYPAIKVPVKPLAKMIKVAEELCEIEDITESARYAEYIKARKIVIMAALEMRYSDSAIAKALKVDRTTIIHHKTSSAHMDDVLYSRYIEKLLLIKTVQNG